MKSVSTSYSTHAVSPGFSPAPGNFAQTFIGTPELGLEDQIPGAEHRHRGARDRPRRVSERPLPVAFKVEAEQRELDDSAPVPPFAWLAPADRLRCFAELRCHYADLADMDQAEPGAGKPSAAKRLERHRGSAARRPVRAGIERRGPPGPLASPLASLALDHKTARGPYSRHNGDVD